MSNPDPASPEFERELTGLEEMAAITGVDLGQLTGASNDLLDTDDATSDSPNPEVDSQTPTTDPTDTTRPRLAEDLNAELNEFLGKTQSTLSDSAKKSANAIIDILTSPQIDEDSTIEEMLSALKSTQNILAISHADLLIKRAETDLRTAHSLLFLGISSTLYYAITSHQVAQVRNQGLRAAKAVRLALAENPNLGYLEQYHIAMSMPKLGPNTALDIFDRLVTQGIDPNILEALFADFIENQRNRGSNFIVDNCSPMQFQYRAGRVPDRPQDLK